MTGSCWTTRYKAPYLTIVYQNRSYSTGTVRVSRSYPDGFAAKAGYPGGYFESPNREVSLSAIFRSSWWMRNW